MAKRRHWFSYVKSLFSSDPKSKQEKTNQIDPSSNFTTERKKRWFFGKMRARTSLPTPPPAKAKTLKEAEDAQNKRALAVAVATTAAAEAAVAAAQAAAEVVRLTATPLSRQNTHDNAVTKIQTAFRGYLARRALRALKALVKLQAIVRGRAVRRQTSITLKNLQSLIKIQNLARANRIRMVQEIQAREAKERSQRRANKFEEKVYEMFEELNGKTWDDSPLSKEEMKAKFISRKEAALKRERALEYTYSHQGRWSTRRHSMPLGKEHCEEDDMSRRWSWLEQWVDTQPWDKDIPEIHPVPSPKPITRNLHERMLNPTSDFDSSQCNIPERDFRLTMRRSFNRSRRDHIRDDESFTSTPAFPSYMAFTESAKARSRSVSTPKQRAADYYTLQGSSRVSPFPSICSDAALVKPCRLPLTSPRMKGTTPSTTKATQITDS